MTVETAPRASRRIHCTCRCGHTGEAPCRQDCPCTRRTVGSACLTRASLKALPPMPTRRPHTPPLLAPRQLWLHSQTLWRPAPLLWLLLQPCVPFEPPFSHGWPPTVPLSAGCGGASRCSFRSHLSFDAPELLAVVSQAHLSALPDQLHRLLARRLRACGRSVKQPRHRIWCAPQP